MADAPNPQSNHINKGHHHHHHGGGRNKITVLRRPEQQPSPAGIDTASAAAAAASSSGHPAAVASPATPQPRQSRQQYHHQQQQNNRKDVVDTKDDNVIVRQQESTCDLCQVRLNDPSELPAHFRLMHAPLLYWVERVGAMARPVAPSIELAEQIGTAALKLARAKDGGPVAFDAVRKVWNQLRLVISHRELELRVFGSCMAMGFWDGRKGDVDLCFVRRAAKSGSTDPDYPMVSVSDEVKEVMSVCRTLRDAGFAFDDLEPVVRTRVPIVKHKNHAPPVEDAWDRIANNPDARRVRLIFNQAKDVLEEIFDAEKDRCEWRGRELVITTRNTTEACQVYRSPWTYFVTGALEKALRRSRAERARREQQEREAAAAVAAAARGRGGGDDGDDYGDNSSASHPPSHNFDPEMYPKGLSTMQLQQLLKREFHALDGSIIADVRTQMDNDPRRTFDALAAINASAIVEQNETGGGGASSNNISSRHQAAAGTRAAQQDDHRRLVAQYPIEGVTRGQFDKWLRTSAWYSNEFFVFPEMFHCDFDISFRSAGFRNSLLLRAYFLQSPLARVGAMFVKQWSKDSAVNLAIKGYWTTYCVNIVWIHFLIQRGAVKWVDPASIPVYVDNETFEQDLLRYVPVLSGMEESDERELARRVGELLFEFFRYYGYDFDWGSKVVTLRQKEAFARDEVPTAAQPWTYENEKREGKFRDRRWYRLCIDDPYEGDLSLGRHLSPMKSQRLLAQFKFMAQRLAKQKPVDDDEEQQKKKNNDQKSGDKKQGAAAAAAAFSVPAPKSAWAAPETAKKGSKSASSKSAGNSSSDEDDESNIHPFPNRESDPTSGLATGERGVPIAVPTAGPLLVDIRPDALTVDAMETELAEMLIDCHHTDVQEWLQRLSATALFRLAGLNTFNPLDEILAKVTCDVCEIPILSGGDDDDGDASHPTTVYRILQRDPAKTYVPPEAKLPLQRLRNKIARRGYVEVDKKMVELSLLLQGEYLFALRRLFPIHSTDYGAAGTIVLFRSKDDKDAYDAARRPHEKKVVIKKDPNRSRVGTCGDCGLRQRRIYGSTDKSDPGSYCDQCWEAYTQ